MTIICMVRHGQTDRNKQKIIQGRGDYELNSEGIKQAKELGKVFKSQNEYFDIIYTSPLKRAKDTSQYIAHEIGYKSEIIIDNDLIEREFGKADGVLIEPLIYEQILNDQVEAMEKSYEIQHRVVKTIFKIAHSNENKKVLVVAHSHVIKALLTAIDSNYSFKDSLNNCSTHYFTVEKEILEQKKNI